MDLWTAYNWKLRFGDILELPKRLRGAYVLLGSISAEAMDIDFDENDTAEDQLQNLLSVLSRQCGINSTPGSNDLDSEGHQPSDLSAHSPDITKWIWEKLNSGQPIAAESKTAIITFNPKWEAALDRMQDLLPRITAFDLHTVASQAILFAEQEEEEVSENGNSELFSPDFPTLCLLLCAYALHQCPSPLTKRVKRWQSILCETIRLFQQQNQHTEPSTTMANLWMHHLCPACLCVVQQLAGSNDKDSIHHVGLFVGLVGTSLIVVEQCIVPNCDNDKELLQQLEVPSSTLQSICDAFSSCRDCTSDITTIWENSWRSYYWNLRQATTDYQTNEGDVDHDLEFWIHRNDLSWWINGASQEDRVANMDTSWSSTSVAMTAAVAFQERALVYHPEFMWKLWFPITTQLFKECRSYPKLLSKLSMKLLQSLLSIVPIQSLALADVAVSDKSFHQRPDAPLEVMQMLSDQMIIPPANSNEAECRIHVQSIAGIIQSLLDKYKPQCQVQIIDKLAHDCPNPGLQARFLDMLRPILFVEECQKSLAKLLNHQIDSLLQQHLDQLSKQVINVEDLMENVEIYASTIGLVQKWSMGSDKNGSREGINDMLSKLQGFHATLQQLLDQWSSESPDFHPPENHFRLLLLDSALGFALSL